MDDEYVRRRTQFLRNIKFEDIDSERMETLQPMDQYRKNYRPVVVDWLFELIDVYDISCNTIERTVMYVDIYTSMASVKRDKIQFVAMVALFLACKFGETDKLRLRVNDITELDGGGCYDASHVRVYEKHMLKLLQWNLNRTTMSDVLDHLLTLVDCNDLVVALARRACRVALKHPDMIGKPPFEVAVGSLRFALISTTESGDDAFVRRLRGLGVPGMSDTVKTLLDLLSNSYV